MPVEEETTTVESSKSNKYNKRRWFSPQKRAAGYAADLKARVHTYGKKEDQLILVRDQIGICPLFYTVADGQVIFCSEIKGILECPWVERKLNLKAVDQLMNYPGVVSPETFFDGIRSLRAGHLLVIKRHQEIKDIEYWDLIYSAEEEDDSQKS